MRVKVTKYTNEATAVWTATGIKPTVVRDDNGYGEFAFPYTEEILQAFGRYESGDLRVDAKSILINRSNLLKLVKEGR